MHYLRVARWDEYQHYKDRSPPWIKLHNEFLEDYQYCSLMDAQKSHLLAIMLLASRTNNKIPADEAWIKSKISATSKVDLTPLIEAGFLEEIPRESALQTNNKHASDTLATRYQSACLEERREETEKRRERAEDVPVISNDQQYSFDIFWSLFPKKQQKQLAMKSWGKLTSDEQDLAILDMGERPEKDKQWTDKKFIPYPTTYLNGKRWQDEYQEITHEPTFDEILAQNLGKGSGDDIQHNETALPVIHE